MRCHPLAQCAILVVLVYSNIPVKPPRSCTLSGAKHTRRPGLGTIPRQVRSPVRANSSGIWYGGMEDGKGVRPRSL
jgi:hypothetical protein